MDHIYHEKQKAGLCALHTLNNLLQYAAFDVKSLDGICRKLDSGAWVSQHKSPWGWGDYDINVISVALETKGYEIHWLDKRIDPGDINFARVFGIIINVPSSESRWSSWIPFFSGRHWLSIRDLPTEKERRDGKFHFWKLDSVYDRPQSLGNLGSLLYFLRNHVKSGNHVILVLTKEVAKNNEFKRHKSNEENGEPSTSSSS